jgi:hypothetical protein
MNSSRSSPILCCEESNATEPGDEEAFNPGTRTSRVHRSRYKPTRGAVQDIALHKRLTQSQETQTAQCHSSGQQTP